MIELRQVEASNFEEVIRLKVSSEQEVFVASNIYSIAQAKILPECVPLAIYHDEILIGFAMYAMDRDDNEYWIYRFMIDERYQSKGYGRAALKVLIDYLKKDIEHHVILLGVIPGNERARKLYECCGFLSDGRMLDNELIYTLRY